MNPNMLKTAAACCLLFLACTSNKTENKPDQAAAETPAASATEGFLGTPWGTDLTAVQGTWLMRPASEMGEVTVYATGISTYKTIPIQSTTAAFRKNKLIGMGFEVHDNQAIQRLIDEFNGTYGGTQKKPTSQSSTGSAANADSLGVQTTYRWETLQSTVVLMRVYGSTSYVFMMKKGESLPQAG